MGIFSTFPAGGRSVRTEIALRLVSLAVLLHLPVDGTADVRIDPAQLEVMGACVRPTIVSIEANLLNQTLVVTFDRPMNPVYVGDSFYYSIHTTLSPPDFYSGAEDTLVENSGTRVTLVVTELYPLLPNTDYLLQTFNLYDSTGVLSECHLVDPETAIPFRTPCVQVQLQPRSRVVSPNCQVTFETAGRWVGGPNPEPLRYQWYRDGNPIEGATNRILTIGPVTEGDQGASFHAAITSTAECNPVATSNAVLSISLDDAPLVVLGARPGPVANTVMLSFSNPCGEPDGGLERLLAGDEFNYLINEGTVLLVGAYLDCSGTNVYLATTPLQPGAEYTVTVSSGVQDVAGHGVGVVNSATFTAPETEPVPGEQIRMVTEGNWIFLEWAVGGTLQTSGELTGPWTDVPAGPVSYVIRPSPYTCANLQELIENRRQFYRVRFGNP